MAYVMLHTQLQSETSLVVFRNRSMQICKHNNMQQVYQLVFHAVHLRCVLSAYLVNLVLPRHVNALMTAVVKDDSVPGCVRRNAATRAGEAFRPMRLFTMADVLESLGLWVLGSLGLSPGPSRTATCTRHALF